MSQSVPSYRPGQAHRLEYKDIAKSLHPSREKGQKSSFRRLTNLTSEMINNKSRQVLKHKKYYIMAGCYLQIKIKQSHTSFLSM